MADETKKHADLMVEYVRVKGTWGRHLYDDAKVEWSHNSEVLEIWDIKGEPKLVAQYRGGNVICVCSDVWLFADEFWKPK